MAACSLHLIYISPCLQAPTRLPSGITIFSLIMSTIHFSHYSVEPWRLATVINGVFIFFFPGGINVL